VCNANIVYTLFRLKKGWQLRHHHKLLNVQFVNSHLSIVNCQLKSYLAHYQSLRFEILKKVKLLPLKPNFAIRFAWVITRNFLFSLVAFNLFSASVFGQNTEDPKSYVCYRSQKALKIDGKLNEGSWKKAEWTDLFVDIEGQKKPLPLQKTRAKMLWDDTYLYIGTEIEEAHIWAYQDKKDQIVFHENDFEVFIDPDGDSQNYYELEINAINNSFDLFLPKTYKKGGKARLNWDIKDLKSAVTVNGTINNPSDTDKSWTLEIAIPLSSLSTEQVAAIIPKDRSVWRINFSRVNWQQSIADGKYSRKRNPETNRFLPEYNWVWSPQGVINMHVPEKWGYLQFSSNKAGKKKAALSPSKATGKSNPQLSDRSKP